MWHLTSDTWHLTPDTLYVTRDNDMWHIVRGEHSLKMSAPYLLGLGLFSVLKILNKWITDLINQLINEWLTRVFVEQPRLHRVCNFLSTVVAACISITYFK